MKTEKIEKKQERNKVKERETAISIVVPVVMGVVMSAITYLLNQSYAEMFRGVLSVLTGFLAVLFLWHQSEENGTLEYDNSRHKIRFFVLFLLCFFLSVGMAFLPPPSWVFLPLMILLSMYSNAFIGLVAGSILLMVTVLLAEGGTLFLFFLYYLTGLIGISLFRKMDVDFQIAAPLGLSGGFAFLLQTAYLMLPLNRKLNPEMFLMPVLNLFINMILLFMILRFFSRTAMYRIQDKYSEINDPEFPFLAELKQTNKEKYFQLIHTAYLSDRIAKKLKINYEAAKGCAYYYRLAEKATGEEAASESLPVYAEFPEELKALMEECSHKFYGSKESCVVLTSEKVISSILYYIHANPGKKPPYEAIIQQIFKNLMEGDKLLQCDISMKELQIMKKAYIEEKLYYDFLC